MSTKILPLGLISLITYILLHTTFTVLAQEGDSVVSGHHTDSLAPDNYTTATQNDDTVKPESIDTNTSKASKNISKNDAKLKVYYFQLFEEIMPPAGRLVEQAVADAKDKKADVLFMELDTYGGRVDVADEIRTALLSMDIPVIVLIRNNAASAGALISIACDSIYMTPGSTIGAATVVDQTGAKVDEKYQSYMRNKMRATAEASGRDPDIAEGMVDDRVEIEGITEDGKIITFTVDDAIEHGYCEGEANDRDEVLEDILGLEDYELLEFEASGTESVIRIFMNPAISSILILIILGGIYFELQTPGVGFPLIAAVTAALLYFIPHYLEGLAENWEILIFLVGVVLLALEIFVIPGFGVAGISGILLIVGGLVLSLLNNVDFDFTWVPPTELGKALIIVLVPTLTGLILFLTFGSSLFNTGALSKLALQTEQKAEEGYVIGEADKKQQYIGQIAMAITDLRPAGKIELDNERFDAQADGEYIEKGDKVRVMKTRGAYIIVTKA